MAELNYSDLTIYVTDVLRADGRLKGTHVTDELDAPTEFPSVLVKLLRSTRQPFQIVAGISAGQPDLLHVYLAIECWDFSAQSARDAARKRDRLVKRVVDVLRDNYQLGVNEDGNPRVDFCQVSQIDFGSQKAENSTYASGVLTLDCLARA